MPAIRSMLELAHPSGPHPFQVAQHYFPSMETSCGRCLTIHQGLHAETDAVDAKSQHGLQRGVVQLARSALQGDFGIRGNSELLAQGAAKLPHQGRGQDAGRPTAKVDAVHQFRDRGVAQPLPQAANIPTNPGHILLVGFYRRHAGGKVAVGAFGAAKRNRNVNAERIHPPALLLILLSILTSPRSP